MEHVVANHRFGYHAGRSAVPLNSSSNNSFDGSAAATAVAFRAGAGAGAAGAGFVADTRSGALAAGVHVASSAARAGEHAHRVRGERNALGEKKGASGP